jgi:hypothetical protein
MGAVSVNAFGLLAVRGVRPPSCWLISAAASLFGLIGLLAASARRRWQSALAAFAGVGSLYLALCFGPGVDLQYIDYLPSSTALDRLFPVLFPGDYVYDRALEEYCTCQDCITGVRNRLQAGFLETGHVISALLAAALSGLMAWGWSSYSQASFREEAGAGPDEALRRTRSAGR